jgi:hypothetical protein
MTSEQHHAVHNGPSDLRVFALKVFISTVRHNTAWHERPGETCQERQLIVVEPLHHGIQFITKVPSYYTWPPQDTLTSLLTFHEPTGGVHELFNSNRGYVPILHSDDLRTHSHSVSKLARLGSDTPTPASLKGLSREKPSVSLILGHSVRFLGGPRSPLRPPGGVASQAPLCVSVRWHPSTSLKSAIFASHQPLG